VIHIKKRAMKKWIPKDTPYCYEIINIITSYDENEPPKIKIKPCKWYKYIGRNTLSAVYNDETYTETVKVFRCEYLKYTDMEQSSLLWDMCKECGEHHGDDKWLKSFKKRR